jgi:hypothetical protein
MPEGHQTLLIHYLLMKTILLNLLSMAAVLSLLNGCHLQRYTPATFPGKQLTFGSGGGFSGQVTEYTLLENGQLFQHNTLTKEMKQLRRLGWKKRRWAFAEAEKLNLNKLSFNHPGNRYYFIQVKKGDATHRVTWGNPTEVTPPQLEEFYQQLLSKVNHS